MKTNTLRSINDNFTGFKALIKLWNQHKQSQSENIEINLKQFYAANMSAPLGAILDLLVRQSNNINISGDSQIITILRKNDFLSFYGSSPLLDTNNTTIPYKRFERHDDKNFAAYVTELLNRPELPKFTPKAQQAISTVFSEIFSNAKLHTDTEYIYTCGQFFPSKHCIDFAIVDTGAGIKNTVNTKLGTNMNAIDAIKWALIDGNTTKTGVPGGIGFTILQEFLRLNKGRVQIISNDGYYCNDNNNIRTARFDDNFPGTILNLQIKTDDTHFYKLKSE